MSEEIAREEYDKIAEAYEASRKLDLVKFVQDPTLRNALGNIFGARVLDLACGAGEYSRLIKELGAGRVIGVDISERQIQLAREKEKTLKQGIEYRLGNVFDMDLAQFGEFDLVTSFYLLCYADSKEKIRRTLNGIRRILTDSGVYIGCIGNPDLGTDYFRYGTRARGERKEGNLFNVSLGDFQGNVFCSFTNHHWERQTYEQLFREAGFNFQWMPTVVSEEGVRKYGEDFWKAQLETPNSSVYKLMK